MHIFLDESGSFACPPDGGPSVCCVAALAATEADLPAILSGFREIVLGWRLPTGQEPKGSQLSEKRIDRVVTHLGNFDVVLTIVAIDMGLHTPDEIEAHRHGQAEKIRTCADGPEYKESLRQDFRTLGARVGELSNPLYVQTHLLTLAVADALQTTKIQYAQTHPQALGSFSLRIDAKDKKLTEYERIWADIVKPMLQTISLRKGLISIPGPGFDYSALAPFENPVQAEMPGHLARARDAEMREALASVLSKDGRFHSLDLGRLLQDIRFEDSRTTPGLQLADILANAFRRAVNNRLGERGWRRFGRLLVRDFRGGGAVRYMAMKQGAQSPIRGSAVPYARIAARFEEDARPWHVVIPTH